MNSTSGSITTIPQPPSRSLPFTWGVLCAFGLFVSIPLIQMISYQLQPKTNPLTGPELILNPPVVIEVQAPPPAPEEKETKIEDAKEPPPYLDYETLMTSINPGIGEGGIRIATIDYSAFFDLDDAFEFKDVDEKPAPIRQIQPNYPPHLKSLKIKGAVQVECVVDTQGNVRDAKIVSSSHPDFNRPTLDAVTRWKFTPGKKNMKEVNTRIQIPIVFNI